MVAASAMGNGFPAKAKVDSGIGVILRAVFTCTGCADRTGLFLFAGGIFVAAAGDAAQASSHGTYANGLVIDITLYPVPDVAHVSGTNRLHSVRLELYITREIFTRRKRCDPDAVAAGSGYLYTQRAYLRGRFWRYSLGHGFGLCAAATGTDGRRTYLSRQ